MEIVNWFFGNLHATVPAWLMIGIIYAAFYNALGERWMDDGEFIRRIFLWPPYMALGFLVFLGRRLSRTITRVRESGRVQHKWD